MTFSDEGEKMDTNIQKKHFKHFFNYHKENIIKNYKNINSIIIWYSGHGERDSLLTFKGEQYSLDNIHSIFDNNNRNVAFKIQIVYKLYFCGIFCIFFVLFLY